MTSSTNTPRLSMASTPKMACEYAKNGVYISKGKYDKYAK